MQWKKGAVLLRPGDKYELKQDGCKLQLKIHDVKGLDGGNYKCCADGLVTTASVVVKGMSSLHWVTMNANNLKSYMYIKSWYGPFYCFRTTPVFP